MNRVLLAISIWVISYTFAAGQDVPLSNYRQLTLRVESDTLWQDSLNIIPHTVRIRLPGDTARLRPDDYRVDGSNLIWRQLPPADSVTLSFRVFPFELGRISQKRDSARITKVQDGNYTGYEFDPYEEEGQALVEFKGLDYNGSFARGISFGNSQNLVLNSSFNLQMAGQLGDDVEILAAISDNSIPLQPEGNTAQLQEFDKIFIQLKRKNTSLIAGDFELRRPTGYFMNYYKNLQGATVMNEAELWSKGTLKTQLSGAVAKGKFVRNNLQVQEGNQGPYRLQGRNGERFIIVQAGSEKVFFDGQLLQRGIEEDYVIDYNRGDITFTNKRLITKDSRIIVEFEYSDQNYVRSSLAFNTEYTQDRFKLYMNLYSEQDGRSSIQQELDTTERRRLQNIGDQLAQAFTSGIDTLTENANPITYLLRDTFVDGIVYDSILVYSTDLDSARYTARFSFVGAGNGNYEKVLSSANGQVFKWIAPVGGIPRGSYAPIIRLVAPQQQQLYSFGGSFALSKYSTISAEVALSNNDLNRFSSLDSDDDTGLAVYTHHEYEKKIGKPESVWTLATDLRYEFVQSTFRALNPYRAAEFTRDWNLRASRTNQETPVANATENILIGGVELRHQKFGQLAYEFSSFLRQDLYTGTKHTVQALIDERGWRLDAQGSLLESASDFEHTTFFRPKIDVSKSLQQGKGWTVGVYGEREKNERFSVNTDTLNPNSFYYDLYKVYLKSPKNQAFGLGVNYTKRFDYAPLGSEFTRNTVAQELNLNGKWLQQRNSRLNWNVTYRQLEIVDEKLTNQEAQETYLGRLDYDLNLWKGTLRFNNTYEIGSGQEPKLEFNYLQVNAGEGVYTWIDRNRDSVTQINEFEIAAFQDQADYIRVSIFTDEFIRTNNVQFNQSLRLNPKAIWFKEEGLKKVLSKFSTQSTLKIIRRARNVAGVSPWNPFQLSIADSALVSVSSNIRNTLFFNRADPKYDFQIGQFDNRSRVVLTTGFESRRSAEQFFRSRWNITQQLSAQFYAANGQRENDSEFFAERDYQIHFFKIEPQLTWLLKKNFRAMLSYQYQDSKNLIGDNGETALAHDFKIETTFTQSTKTAIRSSFSFVNIDYTGTRNTPVEFAMLEGLQNGRNFLWNVSFDRLLANNIQLSISYEGRKTGEAKVVHVGRAQVRATF